MKNTVRIAAALFVSLMLVAAASCGENNTPPVPSDTINETSAAAETEPEITEPPIIKAEKIEAAIIGDGDPIEGETRRLEVSVMPEDTSDKSYSVTFSDNKIARTNENGDIYFLAPGAVKITVASADGPEAVFEYSVKSVEGDMNYPQTDFPRITGRSPCADNKYWCLSGTTVEDSTVHADITVKAADGSTSVQTMDITPQGTRFFFMFRLTRNQSAYIELTAKAPGMRTSKASSSSAVMERLRGNHTMVYVGENSWLHYYGTEEDFKGINLLSDDELASLERQVFKTLENLRKRSGREDIKSIYLIAPNNSTIYPENAPTEWKENKVSDNSRLKQVIALSKTWNDENIIFIDLYDYLVSQKGIGHIYYQTDTHWNKVGAYFGYYKLMNAIAVDFPEAKPHEFSDFTMSEITCSGDMASYLGFGGNAGSEKTLTLTPNFQTAVTSLTGGDYGSNGVITSTVDNDKLPSAVVQRDSFGTALHSFLAEHFSKLVYTTFGADRSEAYKVCEEISPDYFIRIMVERYLYGSILN